MKTKQRHHLKENKVASLVERAVTSMAANRQQVLAIVALIAIVVAAFGGYLVWRARTNAAAADLLAQGILILEAPVVPPPPPGQPEAPGSYPTERAKLEAALERCLLAAEGYPRTAAGVAARYQAAGLLALLDRPDEAAQRFQEVMDLAGQSSIYVEMARLGRANAQAQGANYDEAIAALQGLTTVTGGDVPPDAMLMELARVYLTAGRPAEARDTLMRLVEEYPESQFAPEAQREVDVLGLTG
jgi:predicted negative regulator of RcsB-dependent stress response